MKPPRSRPAILALSALLLPWALSAAAQALASAPLGSQALESAAEVRARAERGDVAAANELGIIYATGDGVAHDDAEALRWFRRAADAGNAEAMYSIGIFYRDGRAVARDVAEALRWYRRAAEAGYAAAMHNLGVTYMDGNGVAPDEAEAFRWYRRGPRQEMSQRCTISHVSMRSDAGWRVTMGKRCDGTGGRPSPVTNMR